MAATQRKNVAVFDTFDSPDFDDDGGGGVSLPLETSLLAFPPILPLPRIQLLLKCHGFRCT